MEPVVQIPVDQLLDRLGHIELQQKRLGLVNHGYGVRLAIVEIQRLANEVRAAGQAPLPPATDVTLPVAS